MSSFSEAALEKKLAELNNSQQSIQTLSLWLIHHRKHHVAIVKIWLKEFLKVKDSKKLTFIYLVNDVIQNSRKKGPEFRNEFAPILAPALKVMVKTVSDEKTIQRIERILNIWDERKIFDSKQIAEFRSSLESSEKSKSDGDEPPMKIAKIVEPREKLDLPNKIFDESEISTRDNLRIEPLEIVHFATTGKKDVSLTLSLKHSPAEAPEPDELIKALQGLENAASCDAIVRERIAKFPAEISDLGLLTKISDQVGAESLASQVNEAFQVLSEYNARLAKEMEDRKILTKMLHDFTAAQREMLLRAEERLQEYKEKLAKVYQVREELRSHIQSLPDLSQLPDVSAVPLPSAGDLFNLH